MSDTGVLFGPDTMNAAWGLDSSLKLVALVCHFFDADQVAESHAAIGNRSADSEKAPAPLNVTDFLKFRETTELFPSVPNALYVTLEEMVSGGLLVSMGNAKPSMTDLSNH